MTPEEYADSIAKWTNQGMRQAVIDVIASAVQAEHARTLDQAAVKLDSMAEGLEDLRKSFTEFSDSSIVVETLRNASAAIRALK